MTFFDRLRWNTAKPSNAAKLSRQGLGQLTLAEREYEAGNLEQAAAHCQEAARLLYRAAAEAMRKDG
jgi:HEPN domain-containing protein